MNFFPLWMVREHLKDERSTHRALLSMESGMEVECDKLVSVLVDWINLVSHSKCISMHTRFL